VRGASDSGIPISREKDGDSANSPRLRVLEGRLTALQRLAARVRRGERLQLVCACKVHTLNSCHGDVIVDWVRGRLRPE
jgi:hypothetical protein